MKRNNKILILALFLLNLGFTQQIDSIIDKTVANYSNLNSFYIEFTQQFCEKTTNICQNFNGCVYFLKPNYFRMEIDNPRQVYVGDSISLWIYLPDKKRAVRQNLGGQIPFAINPDIFLKDYGERFSAELKVNKNYEIILMPKEETEIYQKIIVAIDKDKYEIVGISIFDETESENRFSFKNIKLNKKISKKLFEFKPPKGTEIIEE